MGDRDHARSSVIIPAKDAAKTLSETLDSLLAQRDPDWEALIIDDD
jgi:glycosyltransferase involved in cell wall biosynthesis